MSYEDENVLQLKKRRLQKLKEQQAVFGIETPPQISIEIENLEIEIEKLQTETSNFREPTPSIFVRPTKSTREPKQRTQIVGLVGLSIILVIAAILGMNFPRFSRQEEKRVY